MYLLTIREGLQTRHVGPYESPKHAADDLERLLISCSERARWQIHALESPAGWPSGLNGSGATKGRSARMAGVAA
jgi:hypothetical protein